VERAGLYKAPRRRTTGSVRGYTRCRASAPHCRLAPASIGAVGAPQRPQKLCDCARNRCKPCGAPLAATTTATAPAALLLVCHAPRPLANAGRGPTPRPPARANGKQTCREPPQQLPHLSTATAQRCRRWADYRPARRADCKRGPCPKHSLATPHPDHHRRAPSRQSQTGIGSSRAWRALPGARGAVSPPERGRPCTARAGRRAARPRTTCHCESATAWPATASSVASSSGISARSSLTCAHQRPGSPDSAAVRRAAAPNRAERHSQCAIMHGVLTCARRALRASAQRRRGCARRRRRGRPGPSARMRIRRAVVRASLPIGPACAAAARAPRRLAIGHLCL